LPIPNCHHYSKLKEDDVYTSMYLLGLRQSTDAADSYALLAPVFANLTVVQPVPMDSGLVKSNNRPTFLSGFVFVCLVLVMI
jgi:hypothetical protein